MKRCPTLLVTREMQVKTTKSYDLTLIRMASMKKMKKREKKTQVVGENVEKLES